MLRNAYTSPVPASAAWDLQPLVVCSSQMQKVEGRHPDKFILYRCLSPSDVLKAHFQLVKVDLPDLKRVASADPL